MGRRVHSIGLNLLQVGSNGRRTVERSWLHDEQNDFGNDNNYSEYWLLPVRRAVLTKIQESNSACREREPLSVSSYKFGNFAQRASAVQAVIPYRRLTAVIR